MQSDRMSGVSPGQDLAHLLQLVVVLAVAKAVAKAVDGKGEIVDSPQFPA